MDTRFADDLGADSLDIFQIVMGIEEAFDIEISADAAEKIVHRRGRREPDQEAHEINIDTYSREGLRSGSSLEWFIRNRVTYYEENCLQELEKKIGLPL